MHVAIEDERRGRPVPGVGIEHRAGHIFVEQPSGPRGPIHAPLDGAVADDQGEALGQPLGDRPRERIAAAGDERHVHPGLHGGVNGGAIGRGKPARGVEQRAVDVNADKLDHQGSSPQASGFGLQASGKALATGLKPAEARGPKPEAFVD